MDIRVGFFFLFMCVFFFGKKLSVDRIFLDKD